MKIEQLKQRLEGHRPTLEVELKIPLDVMDDLRRVAAARRFSSSEALMRAYVGQGLRLDLEQLENKSNFPHKSKSSPKGIRATKLASRTIKSNKSPLLRGR